MKDREKQELLELIQHLQKEVKQLNKKLGQAATCPICDKKYEREKGWHGTCGRRCYRVAMKAKELLKDDMGRKCLTCGGTIPEDAPRKKKYCSKECGKLAMSRYI